AGYEETGFTEPGAMAPTLTLPARLLHVLPDDADLTAAALLEPAACIAAAALKARAVPGERVAVVGTGTLGMFAVQFLRAASPAELLVVGTRRDREDLAVRFGATDFRTRDEELPGGFDVVIETAGSAEAARTSAALLRRGGRLVLTGIPAPGAAGLDPTDLVVRQLEVHTVFGAPPAAWSHTVRVFAAGLLDPLPLVTHRLPLTAFARAIELVGSRDPAVGKVLLHPEEPEKPEEAETQAPAESAKPQAPPESEPPREPAGHRAGGLGRPGGGQGAAPPRGAREARGVRDPGARGVGDAPGAPGDRAAPGAEGPLLTVRRAGGD